jgi:pimeloyl-ACP methyl ester carboxylesterase
MPCWKSAAIKRLLPLLQLALLLLVGSAAHAQSAAELQQLRADRVGNDVLVSANVVFDLPSVVEDALAKGIPLYFLIESDLLQERWYWYDKKFSTAQRQLRLVYQPLTRRWRINVTSGPGGENTLGLSLSQNYDTLAEALATIKQISRWKVAELSDVEAAAKYHPADAADKAREMEQLVAGRALKDATLKERVDHARELAEDANADEVGV